MPSGGDRRRREYARHGAGPLIGGLPPLHFLVLADDGVSGECAAEKRREAVIRAAWQPGTAFTMRKRIAASRAPHTLKAMRRWEAASARAPKRSVAVPSRAGHPELTERPTITMAGRPAAVYIGTRWKIRL
ncbi:hypothetical protein HPB50_023412 [Hyalomma asiaticum]|uniref:Uncharacterized protein n=1 Tax=Hyalomma asiaticum TaxID=266040 RepID=A0ACB7S5E2_HYAAI|nr:hypothetical protein HPB50_023412 [Hyalomma asiaticum]